MDNKELPKAVQDSIKYFLMNEDTELLFSEDYIKKGSEIAQSHYEPLLSSKDKEIAEQKEMITKLDNRLSEKEADVKKVMGLLKELHGELCSAVYKSSDDEWRQKMFNEYCKEHHITP